MVKLKSLVGGTVCLDFVNIGAEPIAGGPVVSPENAGRFRRFRTMLRRLLEAEARGAGASPGDLTALNRILARSAARRGLIPTVRGYGWGWLDNAAELDQLLWPIAFSAARLLEGPDLSRLKGCDSCGRLFVDLSRNRTRRWCDMLACGNRAKVARHRARKD